MPHVLRNKLLSWSLLAVVAVTLTGCHGFGGDPRTTLRQSQFRANQLWGQNRTMAQETEQQRRLLAQLQQQNSQLRNNLDIANQRIDNLNAERDALYKQASRSQLSPEATARFKDLERLYPGFKFDEQTGVSELDADLLFDSGSDGIRPQADAVLNALAKELNAGATRQLRVQIVGHTDDRPIVKANTKAKHPTNWHLSTNRANSVLLALKKHGIDERRMRSAGASMFENVADNKDPKLRAKNRRVQIFVLAPDAKDVAARDDAQE